MSRQFILVSHHRQPRTGAHQRLDRLAQRLAEEGRRVLWLSPPRAEFRRWPNVEFLDPGELAGRRAVQLRLLLAALRHRRRLRAQRGRPGVVISFGETCLPASYAVSRLSGAPMSLAVRSHARRCHELEAQRLPSPRQLLSRALLRLRIAGWRFCYRRAAQVVVQSPPAAATLASELRLPPHRLVVVHNDLPQQRTAAHRRGALPARPRSCLFVGDGSYNKGFDVVAAALPRLRTAAPSLERLTCVGVGAAPALAAQARAADLELVLHGRTEVLIPLMARHDLVLVPSREDQFPNIVLEALALGVPVIGSDVDGIAYILGEPWVLFAPGEPQALLDCLARVTDAAGYARAAAIAQARAERFRFDWERQYLQTVEEALPP